MGAQLGEEMGPIYFWPNDVQAIHFWPNEV